MTEFPYITEERPLRQKIARFVLLLLGAALLLANLIGSSLSSPWRELSDFGTPLGFGLVGAALALLPFATELQSASYIQRIGFICLALAAATLASHLF